MNKKITRAVSILAAIILVLIVGYLYPKKIHLELEGIKYRLGEANQEAAEPVKIEVDGRLMKSITGKRTFKGMINVANESIPVPEANREVTIKFGKDGLGPIIYFYYEDGQPYVYPFGDMYMNSNFTKVSISRYEQEKGNSSKSGWSGENGLMIAAPAANRNEALELSNTLMSKYLQGSTPLK